MAGETYVQSEPSGNLGTDKRSIGSTNVAFLAGSERSLLIALCCICASTTGPGYSASIKIVVDQIKVTSRLVGQRSPVTIQCDIEAFLKHFFHLRCGCAELQHSEEPQFGYQFVEESQKLLAKSRLLIICAPLLFITCTREVVKEFLFGDPGCIFLDFVFLQRPGDPRLPLESAC
jgi:hypothetical protein